MIKPNFIFQLFFICSLVIAQQPKYEHLIMYGQSLSTGQQSWPSLSIQNVPNNYMLGKQVWINYNNSGTEILSPLISTVAAQDKNKKNVRSVDSQTTCESPIVGAANYIQQSSKMNPIIATSCGFGGKSIEQLSKEHFNPVHYNDFIKAIETASKVAVKVHCPVIFWMQGEYNYGQDFTKDLGIVKGAPATVDKNTYKSLLLTLKGNMQTDVIKQYGQGDKPLFISYQVGKQYIRNREMTISMAQLESANENEDIICAGPVYYLPDRGGHLDPNGYRWYGEMLGKAYIQTKETGKKFQPLQPIAISRKKDNKGIVIKFKVPKLPLVLDDNLTSKQENYGFELYQDNQKVIIKAVTVKQDILAIITSESLTGNLEIIYAGLGSSGKGNLRDSDPRLGFYKYEDLDQKNDNDEFVFERDSAGTSLHPKTSEPKDMNGNIIYNKQYPLYNFSVAFYYQLQKDITTIKIGK